MPTKTDLPPVSQTLAAFAADLTWADLPDDVRHNTKRSLLNFFGTAFAGAHDVALDHTAAVLDEFKGAGDTTLIGRSDVADPMTAAFINGAAGNVHDYDDTHIRTVIHPTAPVAPAILALAERQRVSGADFLLALALGIETACRVGNAVSPGHYARGWHITATCGVFGAALAVGKLLGLEAARMNNALGAASAQASGLVETLGFMAKSVGVGGAARGGLLAALLAERGLDGPARPLEGPRGFLQVTGDDPDYDEVTGDLGARWEVLNNIHKPYPGGVVLFPVIDACMELLERGVFADDIAKITLYGHPLLRQRADRPGVTTGREAQVSAQHAVAAVLRSGEAGLKQFTDAAVADPGNVGFRHKIFMEDREGIAVAGVCMAVELATGETLEIVIDGARGTDARPLTDDEIETKFLTLAADFASDCKRAAEMVEAVWSLETSGDVGALMKMARPVKAAP
ncbi:MAG: MmgE/PrpD family protein [Rhodospirillales bacterium]|nr:MmgE/PrpD family protein [Rhodospirillales bacterium]MBO6786888.1 MmgE/PrpD family protein [Rhodospirillales bacterium]